jgi:hypothetical protein
MVLTQVRDLETQIKGGKKNESKRQKKSLRAQTEWMLLQASYDTIILFKFFIAWNTC